MERHFRRLAGYLGNQSLREELRADRAWFRRAANAMIGAVRTVLRVVHPSPEERYVGCVPLIPLKAAAGAFGDPQIILDWESDWVEISASRKLKPGMFVAQVVGKSMEPAIPDGAYCLFQAPVAGTRQGRIVLVGLRDSVDPESGERFTVKRYSSEKATAEEGTWRHGTCQQV